MRCADKWIFFFKIKYTHSLWYHFEPLDVFPQLQYIRTVSYNSERKTLFSKKPKRRDPHLSESRPLQLFKAEKDRECSGPPCAYATVGDAVKIRGDRFKKKQASPLSPYTLSSVAVYVCVRPCARARDSPRAHHLLYI